MPSLVSMPPNIMTAALDTTSSAVSVAVAPGSTPSPVSIVAPTCRASASIAVRAAGPISPPTETRSTAATISSYQPRSMAGSVA